MNLSLRPEAERFIANQVKASRFSSAEEMVEAAITMVAGSDPGDEVDADTIAAINEAEEQADRGKGTDLDMFRAQISKRFKAG